MSSANSVNGQGRNAAGMIVGASTLSDGTEHAFLFVGGQMYDLNTLCDLCLLIGFMDRATCIDHKIVDRAAAERGQLGLF